jgi:peptidoglycan pentaglycine glycine transferase (the first glycine)
MHIYPITDRNTWTTFFEQADSPSFHHSWEWGEFQQKSGYEIVRLGLYNNTNLTNLCSIILVIKIRSKRGNFLFIPHGPLSASNNPQDLKIYVSKVLEYLKKLAKTEGFWFIRMAPFLQNTPEYVSIWKDLGFHTAPIYMHAERMWAIDITKSEEEILAGMRKTTRYLIRKAIKDGIHIETRTDDKAIDDFMELYKKTAIRENFTPFSRSFIENEFKTFHKVGDATFYFGKEHSQSTNYIASALVIHTKSTTFYHQGASIHTKLPITYLLQWTALRDAKIRGCQFYNFHGIHQPGRTPKAWTGLSLFKTGFGGFQIDLIPTQDYIIDPKYYFSFIVDKYLAWRRGI